MSAYTIIPEPTNFHQIFDATEAAVNKLLVKRTNSLVRLAEEKGITRTEIAKALKYNPALITRYYPKKTSVREEVKTHESA